MTRASDLTTLAPEDAAAALSAEANDEWARSFLDELDRRVRTEPLERIAELWGLSNSAAARIFGVSRQAFSKWLDRGPPSARAADIGDLAAATDVLDRYVKRERIPAVVRRRAPALDGRSLLELAEAGQIRDVLARTREMFDLRRVQP